MNEAALSLVQQNDGLSVRDNRLIAQNTNCTAEIQELVKRASEYGLPRREEGVWAIKLPRRRDRRCLEIMAVLLPGPSCFQRGSDLTSALFIFDPDEEVCPNKEIVAQLYGLTEAEARVAVMLMEGKTLEQASTLLQRTKETVRKQLQSIFDKTNTNRQSELIRLLLRGPAGLRFRAGECCVQRR